MKKTILSLAVLVFFIFLFTNKTSACVSPFAFAKNFYSINLSVQKTNQSDGDWHSFYNGKLYSNIDFQKDAGLHRRVLDGKEILDSDITIYPKHIEFSVKEAYDCQGTDKEFCQGLIIKNLQELKGVGYLKTSDKEIVSIGKSAQANSIVSKAGFLQIGPIKIPPLKWVSYRDDICYDLDNTSSSFPVFLFWKYINLLTFALFIVIGLVVFVIFLIIKKLFSRKK